MSDLYFIEPLQELIETVLHTACIRDENPISIICIGPSGIGKSMLLSRYLSPALTHSDSISSQGLFDIALRDPKNEIKFLILPDINPTLSRKPSTVQNTIANLLSFTADGTIRIDDGRQAKDCKHAPIGILTAATPEMYARQAKKWFALGLRRRIIPIFFDYTYRTVAKLQEMVRKDKIHSTKPTLKKICLTHRVRPSISDEILRDIETQSGRFAQYLGKLDIPGESFPSLRS
jgi:hypothetical protein